MADYIVIVDEYNSKLAASQAATSLSNAMESEIKAKASEVNAFNSAVEAGNIVIGAAVNAGDYTAEIKVSDIITRNDIRYFGAHSTTEPGYETFDSTIAIQAACNAYALPHIPPGNFIISSPIFMTGEKRGMQGSGKSVSSLTASPSFVGATRNGHTVTSLIWYEVNTGTWNAGFPWHFGGNIDGMTLYCGGYCEGIHLNRVCNGETVRDVAIYNPTIGINCSYTGWANIFDTVQIFGATVASISLNGACNGVTISACELYGNGYITPTHLIVGNNSYGVIFNGGVIEGCNVGAMVFNNSQLTIIGGADVEVCNLLFMEVQNCTDSISSLIGNNFVGNPAQGAVATNNAQISVQGNSFIGAGSGSVPCISSSGTGYISERDNIYSGWSAIFAGNVYNPIVSGQLKFPVTQRPSTDPNILDDYREGTYTPALLFGGNNTGMTYAVQNGTYTKIGNIVIGKVDIDKYMLGTATGAATITLPFTSAQAGSAVIASWSNMSSVMTIIGYIAPGTNTILLQKADGTSTLSLTHADFVNLNDNRIILTFMYFA